MARDLVSAIQVDTNPRSSNTILRADRLYVSTYGLTYPAGIQHVNRTTKLLCIGLDWMWILGYGGRPPNCVTDGCNEQPYFLLAELLRGQMQVLLYDTLPLSHAATCANVIPVE